jgi:hypothetical protein
LQIRRICEAEQDPTKLNAHGELISSEVIRGEKSVFI